MTGTPGALCGMLARSSPCRCLLPQGHPGWKHRCAHGGYHGADLPPLDERIHAALADEGLDESDAATATNAVMRVLRDA